MSSTVKVNFFGVIKMYTKVILKEINLMERAKYIYQMVMFYKENGKMDIISDSLILVLQKKRNPYDV
jgi:hypothetical protein